MCVANKVVKIATNERHDTVKIPENNPWAYLCSKSLSSGLIFREGLYTRGGVFMKGDLHYNNVGFIWGMDIMSEKWEVHRRMPDGKTL